MADLKDKNIAIIGLGLLGTSLGLALKNSPLKRLGWARRRESCQWCLEHDAIDIAPDSLQETLQQADITVLCLPIPAIIQFVIGHARDFKAGSIVTDIGSDKGVIVTAAEAALMPCKVNFVGSHPMAGTENSGCEAAFAQLYDNAEVFLTLTDNTDMKSADTVEALWRSTGASSIRRITPEAHDRLVAHTSHISHLLALALTLAVLDGNDAEEEALRYSGCATGFRDTSRIASSSPAMWREIIENNQPAVLEAARRCEEIYHDIVQTIADKDFDRFEAKFARGKELRDAWLDYKQRQRKNQN